MSVTVGGDEETLWIGDYVDGSEIWPDDVRIPQFFGAKLARKLWKFSE